MYKDFFCMESWAVSRVHSELLLANDEKLLVVFKGKGSWKLFYIIWGPPLMTVLGDWFNFPRTPRGFSSQSACQTGPTDVRLARMVSATFTLLLEREINPLKRWEYLCVVSKLRPTHRSSPSQCAEESLSITEYCVLKCCSWLQPLSSERTMGLWPCSLSATEWCWCHLDWFIGGSIISNFPLFTTVFCQLNAWLQYGSVVCLLPNNCSNLKKHLHLHQRHKALQVRNQL